MNKVTVDIYFDVKKTRLWIFRMCMIVRRTFIPRSLEGYPFLLNLCTGRPLTESDDTRCCISTIQPPDDEHIMPKTCRGL